MSDRALLMRMLRSTLVILIIAGTAPSWAQIQWPLEPFNQAHESIKTYGDWNGYQVYQDTTGALGYHSGVDMPTALWTPVYAAEAGTIRSVHPDPGGDQGFINISPTTTDKVAWHYGHLDSLLFDPDDAGTTAVTAGQKLA